MKKYTYNQFREDYIKETGEMDGLEAFALELLQVNRLYEQHTPEKWVELMVADLYITELHSC